MAVCACLNAADAHYWYGAHFGDIAAFAQPGFSPFYTPLMGSLIALAVQLFFCYRISVFGSSTSASAMWWTVSVLIAAVRVLPPTPCQPVPEELELIPHPSFRSPSSKRRAERAEASSPSLPRTSSTTTRARGSSTCVSFPSFLHLIQLFPCGAYTDVARR
jgi:hypothetical protein